jgi:hypothetical protein
MSNCQNAWQDCYTEEIALSNLVFMRLKWNVRCPDDGGRRGQAQRRHSAVALAEQGSYEGNARQ